MESTSTKPPSRFSQQRLKAWQPLLTPTWIIGIFVSVGIIFPVIGGILLGESDRVVEIVERYDEKCTLDSSCTFSFTTTKDMEAPIFMYYQLTGMYQNHRRYVTSFSSAQLRGSEIGLSTARDKCKPLGTGKDTGDADKVLYPCGLVAGSYFTDSFSITAGGVAVPWREEGIAWDTDVEDKFRGRNITDNEVNIVDQNGRLVTLPDVDSEELMVWMKVAGLKTFKKLHRIIDQNIPANTVLSITVDNTYDVESFGGTKAVVLSTTCWLGGKNPFIGLAYCIVGGCCLLIAAGMAFGQRMKMRPELEAVEKFRYKARHKSTAELPDMSRINGTHTSQDVEMEAVNLDAHEEEFGSPGGHLHRRMDITIEEDDLKEFDDD